MTSPREQLFLSEATVEGADFSQRRFREVGIAGSRLIDCDFNGSKMIDDTGLGNRGKPSAYLNCNFDRTQWRYVFPGRAAFASCTFLNVAIRNVIFMDAEFIDCIFSGSFAHVIFSARPREVDEELGRSINAYHGNDFSRVEMRDVAFRGGIDLDRQRLPGLSDYLVIRNAEAALDKARSALQTWPEIAVREEAASHLEVLEDDVRLGQQDLFVPKSFLNKDLPVSLVDKLVAALLGPSA